MSLFVYIVYIEKLIKIGKKHNTKKSLFQLYKNHSTVNAFIEATGNDIVD